MGDRHVCNEEYKCELSGTNKLLVPDHIDRRVESGSSSTTLLHNVRISHESFKFFFLFFVKIYYYLQQHISFYFFPKVPSSLRRLLLPHSASLVLITDEYMCT